MAELFMYSGGVRLHLRAWPGQFAADDDPNESPVSKAGNVKVKNPSGWTMCHRPGWVTSRQPDQNMRLCGDCVRRLKKYEHERDTPTPEVRRKGYRSVETVRVEGLL